MSRGITLLLLLLNVSVPVLASDELTISATQDTVSQAIVAILIAGVFGLLAIEMAHRVLVIFSAVALDVAVYVPDALSPDSV